MTAVFYDHTGRLVPIQDELVVSATAPPEHVVTLDVPAEVAAVILRDRLTVDAARALVAGGQDADG
jgi:hypothetical protein